MCIIMSLNVNEMELKDPAEDLARFKTKWGRGAQ